MKSKKLNIVIALIVAVALWAYVVGALNPVGTQVLREIPINFINADQLAERGLAIAGTSADMMEINVSGARSTLARLDTADVIASVDLSTAKQGENKLTVKVIVPAGVTIESRSLSSLTVNVESLTTKTIDVVIVYAGTFKENEEGTTTAVSSSQVNVSGAESLVNIVEYARGSINASRLTEEESSITCQLTPVNHDGNTVSGVTLSQDQVTVTSIISKVKEVTLTVPITDNSNDDNERAPAAPKTVWIAGRADILSGITALSAETVDISDITETTDVALSFDLPEGVRISERNGELMLHVDVRGRMEKAFTFTADEIQLSGTSRDMSYAFPKDAEITVTVKGKPSVVESLEKSSITLGASAAGLEAGSHEVVLEARLSISVTSVAAEPAKLTLTVTANESGNAEAGGTANSGARTPGGNDISGG